jgi:preprotein translocase subunit YajC
MELLGPVVNFLIWMGLFYFSLYRQRKRYEKIIAGMQDDISRRELEVEVKMRRINDRERTEERDI